MPFNSDYFNFSNWKLTLPVDSSGTTKGTAVDILKLTGYENSNFFYDAPDGAMVLRANYDGATTSGSKYARTELREMNGSSRAEWNLSTGGTMSATLKIDELPKYKDDTPGRFVIGQIHGADNELVRLYYDNGKTYFVNDLAGPFNKETTFTFSNAKGEEPNISLGEKFSYVIDAKGSTLHVKIFADGQEYSSKSTINAIWQTDSLYFKAGVYLGINEFNGTGNGQASFYGLDFSHTQGEGLGGWKYNLDTTPPDTTGGSNTSWVNGDAANNVINGTSRNETISGKEGNDTINGGGGNDYLRGNEGDDVLNGGIGADTLRGGAGKDVFVFSDRGAIDTVEDFSASGGDRIDVSGLLKGAVGFKQATAVSDGYLELRQIGSDVGVFIDTDGKAGSAQKVQVGLLLDETLSTVPLKSFILPWDTKAPVITTSTTPSSVTGTTITGTAAADTLSGGSNADSLSGLGGNDYLRGNDGNDTLSGGDGNDRLQGGRGADVLTGGNGNDIFIFNGLSEGGDTITDFQTGDKIDVSLLLDTIFNHSTLNAAALVSQGYLSVTDVTSTSAQIYVDADGSAGAGKGVLLATLAVHPDTTLDSSIFLI